MDQILCGYKLEADVDYLLRSITCWIESKMPEKQMKSETLRNKVS